MNIRYVSMVAAMAAVLLIPTAAEAAEKSNALTIHHTPVTWAVKGQPLTLKARVSGGVGGVENVTLYYAMFRDAAPFRVSMTASGLDMYVGTIEAGLLSGLGIVSYYIEAQDKEGTLEETPWYDVQFKNPDAVPVGRNTPTGGSAASSSPGAANAVEKESSGATIGLIAGAAAAIGVAAYVISDSDSGGSSSGDNTSKAGVYSGDVTICLTVSQQSTVCSNNSMQIFIDSSGSVFSDSLVSGQSLFGNLSGDNFTLTANVSDPATNMTGTIVFDGTVVNDKQIAGIVSGTADVNGTPGTYGGTFTASKSTPP